MMNQASARELRLVVPPTPAQRVLREKWANLPPCPYGCGGKLFGNVCSFNCPPMRMATACGDSPCDLGNSELYGK